MNTMLKTDFATSIDWLLLGVFDWEKIYAMNCPQDQIMRANFTPMPFRDAGQLIVPMMMHLNQMVRFKMVPMHSQYLR